MRADVRLITESMRSSAFGVCGRQSWVMLALSMAVHVNFLSRFPLLSELPSDLKERLAGCMTRYALPRRALALEKGQGGQGLGFVLDGRLQGVDFTPDGREAGLYFVGPGDYYGELSVVDGREAPEYVVAIAKSEILHLPEAHARALLLTHPAAATALARRLADRVREGIAQRNVLALPNPLQRLAAQLLALAREGREVEHAPTHQEIAIMINTTRETVSRNFQVLVSQGVVKRDGERLKIQGEELLRALLEGRQTGSSAE